MIKERFEDLSLGLYVMKLPNPDNPPSEFLQFYSGTDKPETEKYVTIYQALNLYYELFENEYPGSGASMQRTSTGPRRRGRRSCWRSTC